MSSLPVTPEIKEGVHFRLLSREAMNGVVHSLDRLLFLPLLIVSKRKGPYLGFWSNKKETSQAEGWET